MIKRVLLLILCFLLVSCGNNKSVKEEIEYIDPVKDVFIYSLLDTSLKNRIKIANNNKEYENYQFKMLDKEIYDKDLIDINGNTINLKDKDKVMIEIVSVKCSHCVKQLQYIDKFSDNDSYFVQYFNVGNKEEILDLYNQEGINIPDNVVCIAHDDDFEGYIKNEVKIKMYPTLLCYKDGKNSFSISGEMLPDNMKNIYDIAFVNTIKKEDLLDKDGNSLINSYRSVDDVKNDISIENQEKIKEIDNDKHSSELTYKYLGKSIDLENINSASSMYVSEIEDYSILKDKRYVFIFLQLDGEKDENTVSFINTLIDENKDINFVVVLVEGVDNTSLLFNSLDTRFNCPVVSNLGKIPNDLQIIQFDNYPSALFMENGIITGIYSSIKDEESFSKAVDIFLSDNCIAYKKNN